MSDSATPFATGSSFEVRIRRVLGILLGGMMVVAVGGVLSTWALADAARDVDRVEEASAALSGVLEGMVDQETGVRGFVLTGQEPFLETWVPGGANADSSRALFGDLTRDLGVLANASDLDGAIAAWRDIADEEITLVRSGRPDEALAIVASGAAKQRFDTVRAHVRNLDEQLTGIIDARNRRQTELGRLIALVGLAVLCGAFVVIVSMLRWLRRSVTRPLAALTGAVADLDARPFSLLAGEAAGEVAALAVSADRLRSGKDIERNHAVLMAEQNERRRVAADLHDGPVQTLFALQLRLQHAIQIRHDGASTVELFGDAIDILERTQSELRSLMFDLAPPGLGDRPLAEVVAAVVAEAVDPSVSSRVDVPADIALTIASQVVVCRVIVEAVRNASRHSHASEVDVRIRAGQDGVTVDVTDDGVGFDVEATLGPGHFGLDIMRSLVESIGGVFIVSSVPDAGTFVRVVVPPSSRVVEVDDAATYGDHDRLEL